MIFIYLIHLCGRKTSSKMQDNEVVWLNKFISESGICSRREADQRIDEGQVTINNELAQKGDQVFPGDKVRVNGRLIKARNEEEIIFIALNKPVGIVSTTEKVRDNIVKFVNHPDRIFPIGRLDKDSQGLIFLTNNGDMVNKILRAGNNHEKEYVVSVDKPLTDEVIRGLSNGVPMLGTVTKKCKVVKEGVKSFRITLIEGLNRQIRRMCEHFDYEVVKLERVRIMNITLKGISLGEWRDLTEAEMKEIQKLTSESSSEILPKSEPKQRHAFGNVIRKVETKDTKPARTKSLEKKEFRSETSKSGYVEKPKLTKKPFVKKGSAEIDSDFSEIEKPKKPSGTKSNKPPSGKRIGKSRPKVSLKTAKGGKPFLDRGATKSKPKTEKTDSRSKPSVGRPTAGRPGSGQRTKKGGY
jgi:23S rRNA pseudouridine2604 synthase